MVAALTFFLQNDPKNNEDDGNSSEEETKKEKSKKISTMVRAAGVCCASLMEFYRIVEPNRLTAIRKSANCRVQGSKIDIVIFTYKQATFSN